MLNLKVPILMLEFAEFNRIQCPMRGAIDIPNGLRPDGMNRINSLGRSLDKPSFLCAVTLWEAHNNDSMGAGSRKHTAIPPYEKVFGHGWAAAQTELKERRLALLEKPKVGGLFDDDGPEKADFSESDQYCNQFHILGGKIYYDAACDHCYAGLTFQLVPFDMEQIERAIEISGINNYVHYSMTDEDMGQMAMSLETAAGAVAGEAG